MRGTEFPDRPWARVAADFFYHNGTNYLIVVDYYSRDVELCLVKKTVDSPKTITQLKKVFSRHGICDILFTDNGPQFASHEFKNFARSWGFEHLTSSPRYAQSNGEAERAVQTVKSILNKCDDEYLALLTYRNTPLHNGYCPAELSMGRKLKTRVPCSAQELAPKLVDKDKLRRSEKMYRDKMKMNYDRRHRVTDEYVFSPGDRVWVPDLQQSGKVVERRREQPRSIVIETPRSVIRRNERMVRRDLEPTGAQTATNADTTLPDSMHTPDPQTPAAAQTPTAIASPTGDRNQSPVSRYPTRQRQPPKRLDL